VKEKIGAALWVLSLIAVAVAGFLDGADAVDGWEHVPQRVCGFTYEVGVREQGFRCTTLDGELAFYSVPGEWCGKSCDDEYWVSLGEPQVLSVMTDPGGPYPLVRETPMIGTGELIPAEEP